MASPGLEPGLLHGQLLLVIKVAEKALELAEALVVQRLACDPVAAARVAGPCQPNCLHEPMESYTSLHYAQLTEDFYSSYPPATIYRNLVKLRDAGIAPVADRIEGIDRYALASKAAEKHHHPHFLCEDCGKVTCLPAELLLSMTIDGPWSASVEATTVQLRGECPECLGRVAGSSGRREGP